MQETVERGTKAIKADVLAKDIGLNQRQTKMLQELFASDEMAIQDFENLFPDVTRRTLQRDLKRLEDAGLLRRYGETNHLKYIAQEPK